MSYQSELVDFLTGHAFGVDDDVTERAPIVFSVWVIFREHKWVVLR